MFTDHCLILPANIYQFILSPPTFKVTCIIFNPIATYIHTDQSSDKLPKTIAPFPQEDKHLKNFCSPTLAVLSRIKVSALEPIIEREKGKCREIRVCAPCVVRSVARLSRRDPLSQISLLKYSV